MRRGMTATTATTIPATAPDWSQQVEEICCPLCGYNLRGLSEPRCPECGHRFEWHTLIDPAERDASSAFCETALKESPGGSISPFCDPATVTSTFQSS